MKYLRFKIFILISIAYISIRSDLFGFNPCDDEKNRLLEDLLIVNYWDQVQNERLPVTFNNLLHTGYINMPSARMSAEGEFGFGYTDVDPYRIYNARFQVTDFLEISGDYRIYKGINDPVFGSAGFGELSDKGANIKLSLFRPEDSYYRLPGAAIGFEDILGTRAFKAYYVVLTQVILNYNLELSLGYGGHRFQGFFGGMNWFPFRRFDNFMNGLCCVLEYDATDYKHVEHEPHPHGRYQRTPLNIGLKYRLWNTVDLSLSYVRGRAVAFSISTFYNFGNTKGFIPKIEDPMPYEAPVNFEPIGALRPDDVMVQDFLNAMGDQGLEVSGIWLGYECGHKILRFHIFNWVYREEKYVRQRLDALLSALIPSDVDEIVVGIQVDNIVVQEYRYRRPFLNDYYDSEIGPFELAVLTPLQEASYQNPYLYTPLYKEDLETWNIELLPKTHSLFGSTKGKFKFAAGLSLAINGFIHDEVYYSISLGYFLWSNLDNVSDIDFLNPSQIINVRSDIINYYKQRGVTIDEAYLQKLYNFGRGFFGRCAIGLFEPEYGGSALEVLYFPVNSSWAIGAEAAIVKKRSPHGVDFTKKIRKLHGYTPHYSHFRGSQYFLNLYYEWKEAGLGFKANIGKFLANDVGARLEMNRYFPSGLILTFWYTFTNGGDVINGQTYFDKGVAFSIPLDIFYTRSSRSRWGYGMSAWLRDVGVQAYTGSELYYLINEQRQ